MSKSIPPPPGFQPIQRPNGQHAQVTEEVEALGITDYPEMVIDKLKKAGLYSLDEYGEIMNLEPSLQNLITRGSLKTKPVADDTDDESDDDTNADDEDDEDDTEADDQADDSDDEEDPQRTASKKSNRRAHRDAAKYRVRLREAHGKVRALQAQLAFERATVGQFVDAEAAWRLLDPTSITVDSKGAVEGLDEAIADLVERNPFLLADGGEDDEGDDGSARTARNPFGATKSGHPMKPKQQNPPGRNKATLAKKYPVLRGRV